MGLNEDKTNKNYFKKNIYLEKKISDFSNYREFSILNNF